jgi:hypothetical protein
VEERDAAARAQDHLVRRGEQAVGQAVPENDRQMYVPTYVYIFYKS